MQTQNLPFKMKYPFCFGLILGISYFAFELIMSFLLCYTIFFNTKFNVTQELIFSIIDILCCFSYAYLIHYVHIYKFKNVKQMFKNTYIISIIYLILIAITTVDFIAKNASFKKGPDIICGIIIIFGVAFTEETLYRGICCRFLALRYGHNKKGMFLTVFLSGTVFGTMHILNLINGVPLNAIIQQSIMAFAFGCFLSGMYLKSGNLWETILIHFLVDALGLFEVYFIYTKQTVVDAISEMGNVNYFYFLIEFLVILLLTYVFYLRKNKIENLVSNVNLMKKSEFYYM